MNRVGSYRLQPHGKEANENLSQARGALSGERVRSRLQSWAESPGFTRVCARARKGGSIPVLYEGGLSLQDNCIQKDSRHHGLHGSNSRPPRPPPASNSPCEPWHCTVSQPPHRSHWSWAPPPLAFHTRPGAAMPGTRLCHLGPACVEGQTAPTIRAGGGDVDVP